MMIPLSPEHRYSGDDDADRLVHMLRRVCWPVLWRSSGVCQNSGSCVPPHRRCGRTALFWSVECLYYPGPAHQLLGLELGFTLIHLSIHVYLVVAMNLIERKA